MHSEEEDHSVIYEADIPCTSSNAISEPDTGSDIIRNVSYDILLKGVSLNKNVRNMKCKETVLMLKKQLHFQRAWKIPLEYVHLEIGLLPPLIEISDKLQSEMGFLGFPTTVFFEYDKMPRTNHEECLKHGCISRTYFKSAISFLPVQSCEARPKDFCLNKNAVKKLKEIELNINVNNIEAKRLCGEFFDKYGTHILIGSVHFGQIITELSPRTHNRRSLQKNTCICPKAPYSCSRLNKDKPADFEKPLEVVDRDISKKDNFVPIWSFILEEDTFKDEKVLAEFIKKNCEDKLKEIDFDSLEEKALKFSLNTLYTVLKSDTNGELFQGVLRQLSREILNIHSYSVWKNIIQKDEIANELLHSILVTVNTSTKQDVLQAERMFSEILIMSGQVEFNTKADILTWLKQLEKEDIPSYPEVTVVSLNQLVSAIESGDILNAAKNMPSFESDAEQCITRVLSKTISVLIEKLKENTTNDFEFLFLLTCVIPFNFDFRREKAFVTLMSLSRLHLFLQKIKSNFSAFQLVENKSMQVQHAWVTRLLIIEILESQSSDSLSVSALPEEFKKNTIRLHESIKTIILSRESLHDMVREFSRILDDERSEKLAWKKIYKYENNVNKIEVSENPRIDEVVLEPLLKSVLQRLKISEYFPEKLTVEKAMEISDKTFMSPANAGDIPWEMLRRIISCNFNFREKTILECQPKVVYQKRDIMDSDSDSETEGDEQLGEIAEKISIHPQDAFYAIFLCCDPFLKAIICRKLSEMQIAIPLSYPYPEKGFVFAMWPMRHLYFGDNPYPVATTPFKVVSFLRVGDVRFKSKSKLINEILRDQNEEHSTFYHRDCLLGSNPREHYNGAIEASWYIPPSSQGHKKGNCDNISEDQLLILNLRGDAMKYRNQLCQIVQMTHIIVVLLEYTNIANEDCTSFMSELHSKELKVVIVTNNPKTKSERDLRTEMKKYREETKVNKTKTKSILTFDCKTRTEKNIVSLRAEIMQILIEFLKETNQKKKLEDVLGFPSMFSYNVIDEHNPDCKFGKDLALKIFSEINKKYPKHSIKKFLLPLQGQDLWQKWSRQERELKSNGQTQDSEEKLIESMSSIRKKQVDVCNSDDFQAMCMFAGTVSSNIENKTKVMFFLSWFEKFLDQQSRSVLPEQIENLSKVYNLSKKGLKQEITVEKAEENLLNASLGIENFFREFGQIYECYFSCLQDGYNVEDETWKNISNFPFIAAKLLLYGRSIEIMDGDAMSVPITWIKAVFSELETLLEKKKIFSLSVLGIQSSGKSTLLNTMFGLEFPVSSGRCTKGVFLHLLPVNRSDLKYDYIMIFDTEGLSSPDQPNKQTKHDNKLATLAIGIADTVIINIKGEAIGEMENILQIVVHALIRLKQSNQKVELRQSCIFVHQNVNAMDKSYNLRPDIQRTQRNLDKITKEIAEHEHMDYITAFSDVISFESDTDVIYVTNLWHGHPPMAPRSPAYSEDVENISKQILQVCSKRISSYLSVWDTALRIESMWEGILAEDFVFSFRNCLEVKAYTMLQSKFKQLSWGLEKKMHSYWCNNVRPQLFKCTENDIDLKQAELQCTFSNEMQRCFCLAMDELNSFIEKSDLNDHMVHWKENKKNALEENLKIILRDFERRLKQQVTNFRIKLRNNDKETEEKIMQNIADYAKSFKGKGMTDIEMNEKFHDKWIMLLTELAPSTQFETHNSKMINLQDKIKAALRMHFQAHSALLENEPYSLNSLFNDTGDNRLSIDITEIHGRHLSLKSKLRSLQHYLNISHEKMEKCKCKALQLTREFYQQIIHYFAYQEYEDIEYDETHFHHILGLLVSNFERHNARDPDFSFVHEYQINIVLRVTKYAYGKFSELNGKYEEKYNLYSFLQSKKEKAKQVFEDIIKEKKNAVIASNYLCKEISDQLQKKVSSFIAIALKGEMLRQFSFLKSELIIDILTNLAEEDNFRNYMKYIERPEEYARAWVKLKTEKYCFSPECDELPFYASYAKRQLGQNVSLITDTAINTTENKNVKTLSEWAELFCTEVHIFELDFGSSKIFENYPVKDLKEFCDIFTKGINDVENELLKIYMNHDPKNITWEGKAPTDDIFETLWGCPEHCPWCQEPCEVTVRGHVQGDGCPHICRQHRPFASTGIYQKDSENLVTECCNFKVQSYDTLSCGRWCGCEITDCEMYHPYKDYKKYLPNWDISPSTNISGSRFWCWFTCKYINELARYYKKNVPVIPRYWKYITKESAIKSLRSKSDPPRTFFDLIKERFFSY